jgi:signal transduction histidine kinase
VEAAGWVALTASVLTVPALWGYFIALWLVFPDGRPPTVAARRLLIGSGIVAIGGAVVTVFATPQVLGPGSPTHPHPFLGAATADRVLENGDPFVGLILLMGLVAAGMLIARARHVGPVERRQVGWVAVAMVVSLLLTIYNGVLNQEAPHAARLVVDQVATLIYVGGFGVAILRYRLFEIDRIVSRSVVFGGLALFIAGLYTAVVVAAGRLLGDDVGFAASLAATILVALAFQPVRRRLEKVANRMVYGRRATPYEVLVQFSRRSAEDSDEVLMARIPQLIVEGTGASEAAVWTRTLDGYRMASSWPAQLPRRNVAGDETFADPSADISLPVFHQGELLGGLSLVKSAGEEVTPGDEELLGNLASGLGLAMRNTRLTRHLRDRVVELEASRERVQEAADTARRELESALESGAPRQLAGVQAKLREIRARAETLGAEKTAMILGQLEGEVTTAIDAVHVFASGVYPPLLESDGIAVALAGQTRATPIPVEVLDGETGRYPPDVESAVYFTALEAIQNTMKYAEASKVSVKLGQADGRLLFSVTDDGKGFHLEAATGSGIVGMIDRIDTVGGVIRVDSTLGKGSTVSGSIPIG